MCNSRSVEEIQIYMVAHEIKTLKEIVAKV